MKPLRNILASERPLPIVGVPNAYLAKMAEQAGFQALYLSGAGIANICYALPDIGIVSMREVLEEAWRIRAASPLPLLVDIDTGWGSVHALARGVRELARMGVAAVHIEDQTHEKRCGHLEGKTVVSPQEMIQRLTVTIEAIGETDTLVVARTDSYAKEGIEGVIERGIAYRDAGADIFFPEALLTGEEFRQVADHVQLPILANMTEFGVTPLMTLSELKKCHVSIALFPLTIARTMHGAAQKALRKLKEEETQKGFLEEMQTRRETYTILNYLEGYL